MGIHGFSAAWPACGLRICGVAIGIVGLVVGCSGDEEGVKIQPCAPGSVMNCSCGPSGGKATCGNKGLWSPCSCAGNDVAFGGSDVAGGSDTASATDAGSTSTDTGSGSIADTGTASKDTGSASTTDTGSATATDTGSATATDTGSATATDTGSATATDTGSATATDTGSTTATDTASGACTLKTMVLSDLAGSSSVGNQDGKGSQARFNSPRGIGLASDGAILVADRSNHRIRKVALDGTVTTIAGGGLGSTTGAKGKFAYPGGVFEKGGVIYVADASNDQIRKIEAGQVTIVAGTGTQGSTDGEALKKARFYKPQGVVMATDGSLWVADTHNHKIRRIHNGQVSTMAGSSNQGGSDGTGSKARFRYPKAIIMDGADALIADRHNHKIRKITAAGAVTTFAGTYKGDDDGPVSSARFNQPCGVAKGPKGYWVADRDNHRLRHIANGIVTTVAGTAFSGHANGPALKGKLNKPWGIVVAGDGAVYFADSSNHRIRKLACP